MFRRILYATDGSECARKAFELAVRLAKFHNAELYIVHAYGPVPALIGTPFYHTLLEPRLVSAENLLHTLTAECEKEGLTAYHDLVHGPADEAIISEAAHDECDLIVMGECGLGETECGDLGSTCMNVLRKAECPVLIVR